MKKFLSVSSLYQNKCNVPFIRLAGKYLNRFNFNTADKVLVSVKENEITIKKMTKEDTINFLCLENPNIRNLIDSFDLV